ncbi:hydrolase [Photobacterium jeanii]|uniref:Hydrolase n=1 Tax=Photobacterium jeanii TaxID=858640 RepID=A0A178KLV2_9GAMM|nr:metal-dependent hydrolase [Photobacterium jeanii]OAN18368.1 hydrolase [Photobacterium jeanii]PST91950.1 metal-dependent hydrolase [Photobacterium jeanii]
MDSVTQAALGAAVAGVVAGKHCSPKVLLAGAALGTLPDMDVFIHYGDPVSDMVKHRGFSHSIFVLLPFSWLLALAWQRIKPTSFTFMHLWLLIAACLLTHPILDSFTSYGTQLLWPLSASIAVSSIFIIDPLYTVPLLLMVIASLLWRSKGAKLCGIGLGISSLYLAWSVSALSMIENRVEQQLVGTELEGKPVFIAPTPLNTVLWRVVVLGEDTYWEGLSSLLDKNPTIDFIAKERGEWPLADKPDHLQMLEAFTDDFVKYQQIDGTLTATDLRLGMVDYLPFGFRFAQQQADNSWQFMLPTTIEQPNVRIKHVPALWLRLLGNQAIDANLCHQAECPKNQTS